MRKYFLENLNKTKFSQNVGRASEAAAAVFVALQLRRDAFAWKPKLHPTGNIDTFVSPSNENHVIKIKITRQG